MLQTFVTEFHGLLRNIHQVGRIGLPVKAGSMPVIDPFHGIEFTLFNPNDPRHLLPSQRKGFSLILAPSLLNSRIVIRYFRANPESEGICREVMGVFCQVCNQLGVEAVVEGRGEKVIARDKSLKSVGFKDFVEGDLTLIYQP